ncbi:lipocalin family protein [Variovorax sp. OV329]|uniref:lipocalin family protein n=1 Tax=Variovorax sp. OV329 TaxID=1882825 RepID=UPI0008E4542F|nr:lipocalin family protein [Variovorax sp. OV329]SFM17402.1 apolipoprotein D and lipocalin family protein [Variovorax sp. OV329]
MTRRLPPAPTAPPAPRGPSTGTLATAFAIGGALALVALNRSQALRAGPPAGPADGAPLMRAPLQVVAPVDLKRYSGLWYEQARLPNRFEKSCDGPVTAHYTLLQDGTVRVQNRCLREDGRTDEALGIARAVRVPGLPGAGRLKVRFLPSWLGWLPFAWGDYWILKLDRDYEVALVGTPDRQYLWVLSRAQQLDEGTLAGELEYARSLGFDVDRVVRPVAA